MDQNGAPVMSWYISGRLARSSSLLSADRKDLQRTFDEGFQPASL